MYPHHQPQPGHYWPHPQSTAPWPVPPQASYPWPAPTPTGEPVYQVRLHKHTGLVIMWHHHSYTVNGTYGQCEAAIREAQAHNLGLGWWSVVSVLLMNWIAIFTNLSARTTLRRNAAQAHAYAAQQAAQHAGLYAPAGSARPPSIPKRAEPAWAAPTVVKGARPAHGHAAGGTVT